MAITKFDLRQSVLRTAQPMIGSAANDSADTLFPKIDTELSKLFEDRNLLLVSDGTVTFPAAGTTVTFSSNIRLHVNSRVAGGSPTVIDLGSTARSLSASGRMVYAVIDRGAGTATVTDDSATLPAVTSSNQEVVLIAKRVDATDGTKRVYFRNGFSLSAGQTARFGQGGTVFASEFVVADSTDTTKKLIAQLSGSATGKTLTLASAITNDRILTFPDITDTLVSRTNTEALSNKQVSFSTSTDSATTGSNATLAAFTTGVIRLTNSSLVSVSGFPAGNAGQFLIIENKTGNQITINNEEAGATAANRIQTGASSNVSMPNNATFAFTYDSTSSRWQLTGGSGSGSGSGSKNYLSAITASTSSGVPNTGNGNIEQGTTAGFSLGTVTLTSNFPSGVPTFGSGASGNLSISPVSSGQLAGLYSLSYASSAATTAGNFVATDAFFIDKEDQAKMMSFSFAYNAFANASNGNFSGTSSNSFAVAIYDVTNSAWIQPAGVYNMVQSSGVGQCTGTFQTTSNSTQYRLVVYNANATAGAITMYFDDFSVGPQTVQKGPAMSDWQSFTMTIGGSTSAPTKGTVATDLALWRRVGDSMEISYQFSQTGSGSAGSGTYLFPLPSGYTIDSSKCTVTTASVEGGLGTCEAYDGGNAGAGTVRAYNTTNLAMQTAVNNTPSDIGSSRASLGGATVQYALKAMVPITGWSSNSIQSSDTDTRIVGMYASSALSGTVGTANPAIFATAGYDTHSSYNSSTGRYTVPVAGFYTVSSWLNAASAGAALSFVYVNAVRGPCIGPIGYSSGSATVKCNAGDIIDIRTDVNISSWGSTPSNLSITRECGPAVVSATETVAASYTIPSISVPNNSSNLVATGLTKNYDTHGAMNASTGIFTAPVSGKYRVGAYAALSMGGANGSYIMLLNKNGSPVKEGAWQGTATVAPANISGTVQLNAGDTLSIAFFQSSGSSRSTTSTFVANYFDIERVGN